MTVKRDAYNRAKAVLTQAGSESAGKSHVGHGRDYSDGEGRNLLSEARDEFRGQDEGAEHYNSYMTEDHYNAIHEAADGMGISHW